MESSPLPVTCSGRLLVLQGPVGGFFRHLVSAAVSYGCEVVKVHFNLADRVFQGGGVNILCREKPAALTEWLERLCRSKRFDAIIVFGDRRPVHIAAGVVAKRLGIPFYCFEEGYLRPDFVTFEAGGNNARSLLPRERSAFDAKRPTVAVAEPVTPVVRVPPSFTRMSIAAIGYFVVLAVGRPWFPHYRHHRDRSLPGEIIFWLRNGLRKVASRRRDRTIEQALIRDPHRKFFIVALQVHDDLQLVHHAAGWSQERLIEASIRVFALFASKHATLLIRCHPYDRGHRSYRKLVRSLACRFGVDGRTHYIQTGHGPTLLPLAAGLITVNSTMALSALYHNCPVYAVGDSFYHVDGLVGGRLGEDGLADFFTNPPAVDKDLYARFVAALRERTLIIGSFYDKRFWPIVVRGVLRRLQDDGVLARLSEGTAPVGEPRQLPFCRTLAMPVDSPSRPST